MNDPAAPQYLPPRRQPLSDSEKRLLQARIRDARVTAASYGKTVYLTIGVVVVLWVLTLLASDTYWWVITLFWVVVGALLALWIRSEAKKDRRHLVYAAQHLESALERDEAEVYDFRSRAYVRFEEIEDEGGCYAFDLGDDRIAFVIGQEFYEEARFPSLDFSLVYPLDADGRAVTMAIEKRGPKTPPARVIPAGVKRGLAIPEHLEVIEAQLDTLEAALGAPVTAGS